MVGKKDPAVRLQIEKAIAKAEKRTTMTALQRFGD